MYEGWLLLPSGSGVFADSGTGTEMRDEESGMWRERMDRWIGDRWIHD